MKPHERLQNDTDVQKRIQIGGLCNVVVSPELLRLLACPSQLRMN